MRKDAKARAHLLRAARYDAARAEARATERAIAETVSLEEARGAAFAAPAGDRGARTQPWKRLSGLDALVRKGRLSPRQAQAGAAYGAVYRRVRLAGKLPSSLDLRPEGVFSGGAPLSDIVAQAHGAAAAAAALARLRGRLLEQEDLVFACDQVCGEERTVREAAGGEREALRLEAVLKVALDLLAR